MTGLGVGLLLGLSASLPFGLGDTIQPGLYPAEPIARALGAARTLEVVVDGTATASRGVWLRRALTVDAGAAERLELLLKAAGVYVSEVPRIGERAYLFVSIHPGKRPPLEIRYQMAFLTLRHAKPAAVAKKLQAEAAEREKDLGPDQLRTRFTADERTRKIIVRYTSSELLEAYEKIAALLDVPEDKRTRPRLERWRARSMKAMRLLPLFEAKWKEQGRAPLNVVVHVETNSLLIRVPHQLWPDVRRLLEEIDPQPGL